MSKPLVSDDLWAVVAPLLPPEPPKPQGGRPRTSNRAALTGILFALKSGIAGEMPPQELGCGSGMSASGTRAVVEWQHGSVSESRLVSSVPHAHEYGRGLPWPQRRRTVGSTRGI